MVTVASHQLITIIIFIAKNYIHPWRDFAKRFYLVFHARIFLDLRVLKKTKHGWSPTRPFFSPSLLLNWWRWRCTECPYVLGAKQDETISLTAASVPNTDLAHVLSQFRLNSYGLGCYNIDGSTVLYVGSETLMLSWQWANCASQN